MENGARARARAECVQLEASNNAAGTDSRSAPQHVVKLNVGGKRYETTRSTLMRSPYFQTMLSGRHAAPATTDDGCIFIDRDGTLFAPILAFLRGARPRVGALDRAEVLEEAKYYCLDEPGGEEPFREALDAAVGTTSRSGCELSRADIVRAKLAGGGSALCLSGLSLRGIDLSYLDLSGTSLRSTDLTGAICRGTILSKTDCSGATLVNADLSGANLMHADLSNATLNGAILTAANFACAKLCKANLTGANLFNASLDLADVCGADISGANITGVDMHTTNFSKAGRPRWSTPPLGQPLHSDDANSHWGWGKPQQA